MSWLFKTDAGATALVLRLGLAALLFPHGAQKALGWFGGYGVRGTLGYFHDKLGVPPALAALAIAAEFLGPLALLAGAGSRIAALAIAVTMVVAILLVHLPSGFFLPGGAEYNLALIVLCVGVMILGSGPASIDHALTG